MPSGQGFKLVSVSVIKFDAVEPLGWWLALAKKIGIAAPRHAFIKRTALCTIGIFFALALSSPLWMKELSRSKKRMPVLAAVEVVNSSLASCVMRNYFTPRRTRRSRRSELS